MSLYRDTIRQLATVYPQGEATAMARMLFECHFGFTLTDILLGKDSELSSNDCLECQNIVTRLLKNEPIQYVLGKTEFCGLTIKVAPGVLIPRPETVELVEWVEESIEGGSAGFDIGTGSGCIALALADKGFRMEACDVSDEALGIAKENAERLHLEITFRKEDILHSERCGCYDFVVSNPPYICQREAASMERNVLDYEPHTALFVPDDDPLLFYRAIARYAITNMKPGGMLFFEINRAYGFDTMKMLQEYGFENVEIRKDQYGNDRMIRALKPHNLTTS